MLLTTTVLLLISLVSFSRHDPNFNTASENSSIVNWVGRIGAYTSDWLLQIFGLPAFMLLIPLTILAWKLLRGLEIGAPLMRMLGFVLLLCSACMLFYLFPVPLGD